MVPIWWQLVFIYVNAFIKNRRLWFYPYTVHLSPVDSIPSSLTHRTYNHILGLKKKNNRHIYWSKKSFLSNAHFSFIYFISLLFMTGYCKKKGGTYLRVLLIFHYFLTKYHGRKLLKEKSIPSCAAWTVNTIFLDFYTGITCSLIYMTLISHGRHII